MLPDAPVDNVEAGDVSRDAFCVGVVLLDFAVSDVAGENCDFSFPAAFSGFFTCLYTTVGSHGRRKLLRTVLVIPS